MSARQTRRKFLETGVKSGGVLLFGCDRDAEPGAIEACAASEGEHVGQAELVGEGDPALETLLGQGWDARLYTDLSKLERGALVIDNQRFYVRTAFPDLLDPNAPWTIEVSGLTSVPRTLSLAELEPLVEPRGTHLLECSGNAAGGRFGLLSVADWHGVPIVAWLETLAPDSSATRVLVSGFDQHSVPSEGGHSTPGASWIFTFEELTNAGAFLATRMNGEPLPPHHGAPLRLFVPGWYGCTAIKWVNEIAFVDDSAPATAQMKEFAGRTHQTGVPELARDYRPATLDQAAMPVRVEKWRGPRGVWYRVVGILWGGYDVTDALEIRFGASGWERVNVCPSHAYNDPWTLWEHRFQPTSPGSYPISLRVADPNVPQRRLDSGWYVRVVEIDEV